MTMKCSILSIGTRGDVQPFIALALKLQERGYKVQIITCENFAAFVRGYGLECDGSFPSEEGELNQFCEHGLEYAENREAFMEEHFPGKVMGLWNALHRFKPDLLLTNCTSFGLADLWSRVHGVPALIAVMLHPGAMVASKNRPPSGPGCPDLGWLNLPFTQWCYQHFDNLDEQQYVQLVEGLTAEGSPDAQAAQAAVASLKPRDRQRLGVIAAPKLPVLFGVSPSVVGQMEEITPLHCMTGFWTLGPEQQTGHSEFGAKQWTELEAFLDAGDEPIYLGWGSMTPASAERMTALAVGALMRVGKRGVVLKGWGGLARDALTDPVLIEYARKHVFFASTAPHEKLFPRCACIVQHGGSGTFAAALRAGRPVVVTPYFADQFDFGKNLNQLGVGVGLSFYPLVTEEMLADAISTCLESSVSERARDLGKKLVQEDGCSNAVDIIDKVVEDLITTGEWARMHSRQSFPEDSMACRWFSDLKDCWEGVLAAYAGWRIMGTWRPSVGKPKARATLKKFGTATELSGPTVSPSRLPRLLNRKRLGTESADMKKDCL